jgi:hypothetical protein
MVLRKKGWDGMVWIGLIWLRMGISALENTVMNLLVP